MYRLTAPIIRPDNKNLPIIKKLMKEVMGYTDQEIQQFIDTKFMCTVVKHITLEQAELIIQPFNDYNIQGFPYLEDETTNKLVGTIEAGIYKKQEPKEHYYDQPVISREHLVNPWEQKGIERQQNLESRSAEMFVSSNVKLKTTCPYCQSTDTKKISGGSRWLSTGLFGIASSKIGKQWHCNKCKSDF